MGKSDGFEGIPGRWEYYFDSGHSGSAGLREAFGTGDEKRLQNITLTIIEVMAPNAGEDVIDLRETHWKRILLLREFGHNRN